MTLLRSPTAHRRVLDALRATGGIARSAELVAAGVSERLIREAAAAGAILRLRRRWIALPDVDPFLLSAAREGVVLSCVTLAQRRTVWTLYDGEPHVAAAPHAGRVGVDAARVHRAKPLVARAPGALEDSIENALDLVARCQPSEVALAVVESALRLELVTRPGLERLPICRSLRELLAEATPFADSGLETFVPRRLRWMRLRILPQIWIAGHRVDFLIGERLVFQIDGGHHVGAQRESDIRHDAALMLLGYHVIRVGYHQVVDDWASVQDLIMRAVAQGLHLPR